MDRDLLESVKDQLETIRAHHGENYAQLVRFFLLLNTAVDSIGALRRFALNPGDAKDGQIDSACLAGTASISVVCINLSALLGITDEADINGALDWSTQLNAHIDEQNKVRKNYD